MKHDLRLNSKLQNNLQLQDVLDFKVKLIFGSPHTILNNYRHIFRRLKSNFEMLLHRRKSIEHWSLHATNSVRFFTSTCTFHRHCPTFLGFKVPSMIRSFPLLQQSSELRVWFHFCLHNFSTNCLSKVNLHHWIYIKLFSFPVINWNKLWSFSPNRYCQFLFKIFVRNHFSTD